MYVVGVLNTKGGAGKTTITTCLAVAASMEVSNGKNLQIGIMDLDPQASSSNWHKQRGSPPNPQLVMGAERASDVVGPLRSKGAHDVVFIDGPPGSLLVTEDAIRVATLVLIPMRASGLDLGASRDCIQLCQEIGTPFMVVINAKGQHDIRLVEQAQQLLAAWKVPTAKTVVSHRTQYINAYTSGRTGPEKDPKAREEITTLWTEVATAMRTMAAQAGAVAP